MWSCICTVLHLVYDLRKQRNPTEWTPDHDNVQVCVGCLGRFYVYYDANGVRGHEIGLTHRVCPPPHHTQPILGLIFFLSSLYTFSCWCNDFLTNNSDKQRVPCLGSSISSGEKRFIWSNNSLQPLSRYNISPSRIFGRILGGV